MDDSVITEALSRWTDWPLLALLVRALLIGLALVFVDRIASRLVLRAWRKGHDPGRTLAWARPMTRALLGIAGLFGVFAPLHAANPASALALGAVVLGIATIWGLEPLKNVAGGLSLVLSRPFEMGSEIRVGDIVGTVERIELTRICVRTRDGAVMHVPTRRFVTETVVTTVAGGPALPVSVEVPLRHTGPAEAAVSALRDQALLSAYAYAGGAVQVEVIAPGHARVTATPVHPSDAGSLRSDLVARAQWLCRDDAPSA
jgi:small-conductance mechanosensitive channel